MDVVVVGVLAVVAVVTAGEWRMDGGMGAEVLGGVSVAGRG